MAGGLLKVVNDGFLLLGSKAILLEDAVELG